MGWMDGNREVERNRDILRRILALLISLAGLAECAAAAPHPVRLLVLGILRHAEAAARAFVIGMAHDLGAPTTIPGTPAPMTPRDGDADAARLARSFYALALVLDYMLTQARRFCRCANRDAAGAPPRSPPKSRRREERHIPAQTRRPASRALPFPDTS